jgi:hypothetical protein
MTKQQTAAYTRSQGMSQLPSNDAPLTTKALICQDCLAEAHEDGWQAVARPN